MQIRRFSRLITISPYTDGQFSSQAVNDQLLLCIPSGLTVSIHYPNYVLEYKVMTSFLAWLLVFLSKRFVSNFSRKYFLAGKNWFLASASETVLKHVLYLTNALALPPWRVSGLDIEDK